MTRTIQSIRCALGVPQSLADPLAALKQQVKQFDSALLLAFTEDGVIWGKVDGGKLKTAHEASTAFGAELRSSTLLELRLFTLQAEWHAWKTALGWQALTIQDGSGDRQEFYDEALLLWGTDPAGTAAGGFHPVQEADLGISHAPPIALNGRRSLRLVVRHYLAKDDQGALQVQISRLVKLLNGGEQ